MRFHRDDGSAPGWCKKPSTTAAHSAKALSTSPCSRACGVGGVGTIRPDVGRRPVFRASSSLTTKGSALGFNFDGAQGVETGLFGRAGDGGEFFAVKANGYLRSPSCSVTAALMPGTFSAFSRLILVIFGGRPFRAQNHSVKPAVRSGCRRHNARAPVTLTGPSTRWVLGTDVDSFFRPAGIRDHLGFAVWWQRRWLAARPAGCADTCRSGKHCRRTRASPRGGRMRILFQQRRHAHDKARRAIAAHQRVSLDETPAGPWSSWPSWARPSTVVMAVPCASMASIDAGIDRLAVDRARCKRRRWRDRRPPSSRSAADNCAAHRAA